MASGIRAPAGGGAPDRCRVSDTPRQTRHGDVPVGWSGASSRLTPSGRDRSNRGCRSPDVMKFDRYDGPMSAFDKAKDVAGKVEDVTEENVDKLGNLIDKGADKLDEKTGGKHSDKIDQVVDSVQDPADATSRAEGPPNPSAP